MNLRTSRIRLSILSAFALIAAVIAPVFGRPVLAQTAREPVIVLPGIAASEFTARSAFTATVDNGHGGTYTGSYRAGEKIWINYIQALLSGDDDYFDVIKLKADGVTPVAPQLYVSGINQLIYGDLVNYLERQGYVRNKDLFVFPFDYRIDMRTVANTLDTQVTQALVAANGGRTDPATWTIKKVDIVAHSMGGMVARSYVANPTRAARVDQLITIAAPQLGAPKFLKVLMYGDQFGPSFLGLGFNPLALMDVVQNMPGKMSLIPSRAYYDLYDNGDPTRIAPYVEDRDVDGNGTASGVMSYSGVEQLLTNIGKNVLVMNTAESFHDQLDTQRNGGVNGVRWAALIGQGQTTLGQMREYTGTCQTSSGPQLCPKRDEIPIDGDGYVPTMSAAMGNPWLNQMIDTGAQRWYINREHDAMVRRDYSFSLSGGIQISDGPVLPWIGGLLNGTIPMTPPTTNGASRVRASEMATAAAGPSRTPLVQVSGTYISALGPVALHVSDTQGGTAGRMAGEDEAAATTPDVAYQRGQGGEFVTLKQQQTYKLTLSAEQAGTVDLKVRVLKDGRIERTATYIGVKVGPQSSAQLVMPATIRGATAATSWPVLKVDSNGDGAFEQSVKMSALLDAKASADVTAPSVVVPASRGATPDAQGNKVAVRWQTSDAGAGVLTESATLDPGTANARTVKNGETLSLTPGKHRVVVLVQDRAGNATTKELVYTIK